MNKNCIHLDTFCRQRLFHVVGIENIAVIYPDVSGDDREIFSHHAVRGRQKPLFLDEGRATKVGPSFDVE
jgi:hypothetical protein